jgi:hypothetical protein
MAAKMARGLPRLTDHLRKACYAEVSKRCSDVQDWGQVCSFQGKNCGGFGAFTSKMTSLTFLTHWLAQITFPYHSLLPIKRLFLS